MRATTLHDVSIEWNHAHFDATKRWQEAQEKHAAAQEAKLEAKLQARRAARAVPKPLPTSGRGWSIIDAPRVPHVELEEFAKRVWNLMMHNAPWPEGWAVKWAALDKAWGLCVYQERLVLIDERRLRSRTPHDLTRTLVHEFSHILHKAEAIAGTIHGPRFYGTLDSALAHVLPEPDGLAHAEPPAIPRTTARIQEGTTMDDGWEYAMLKTPDGRAVVRSAALKSLAQLKRAIAENGGHAPTGSDGQPMVWNESRGWFPRSPSPAAGGLRLADAMRQQIRVTQEIRFDERRAHGEPVTDLSRRLHAQRRERLEQARADARENEQRGIALYARASETTLDFWRRFCIGFEGNAHPSAEEIEGRDLSYYFPSGRPTLAARQARFDRVGYWEPC